MARRGNGEQEQHGEERERWLAVCRCPRTRPLVRGCSAAQSASNEPHCFRAWRGAGAEHGEKRKWEQEQTVRNASAG